MTTTNIIMGKDNRNSSKILAPPGGKTSILFGGPDEHTEPPKPRRQQSAPQSSPVQKTETVQLCRPAPSEFNPLTGESYAYREQAATATPSPSKQKVEKSRPESLPAAGQRTEGKTRVTQPPGGVSSFTLG